MTSSFFGEDLSFPWKKFQAVQKASKENFLKVAIESKTEMEKIH